MLLFWSSMWLSVFTEPCSPPAWFSLRCGMDEDLLAGLKLVAALNTLDPLPHHSNYPSLMSVPLSLVHAHIREHTCEGQILPSPILPSLANPLVGMDQDQCWLHWHLYLTETNQPFKGIQSIGTDMGYSEQCHTVTVWLFDWQGAITGTGGMSVHYHSLCFCGLPLRASACEGLWVMMWAGSLWTPGPQGQTPESEAWRSSLIKKSCSFSSCSPDSLVNDNIKHRQQDYVDEIARNGTSHFQLWIILQSWDVLYIFIPSLHQKFC